MGRAHAGDGVSEREQECARGELGQEQERGTDLGPKVPPLLG